MDLPLAPLRRILEKTGMRIGKTSAEEFGKILEEIITEISSEALALAQAAGRKTVLASDVKVIRKRLK